MSGLKSRRSRISAVPPRLLPILLPSRWTTPDHVDNSGISAQPTTGDGRSWTTCPLLRIRRSSQREEGARVLAGLRSGDGPLSVRVRPSSLKRDCDRRTTSTGERCLVNVHAKSRLTLEPLRTLRSEDKGQAGACPGRTRAIPCPVRAVTGQFPAGRDSRRVRAQTTGKNRRSRPGGGGASARIGFSAPFLRIIWSWPSIRSADRDWQQQQRPTAGISDRRHRETHTRCAATRVMSGLSGQSFEGAAPPRTSTCALRARAPEMSPNGHQQPTTATSSALQT